jgi:hypothetical protein
MLDILFLLDSKPLLELDDTMTAKSAVDWFSTNKIAYPFGREFWELRKVAFSKPIWVYSVSWDQGDASCSTPPNRVWILQGHILINMENYSDSDTSSESEYNSGGGSAAVSDCDEDELSHDQDLEPEPSEEYNEYRNALWNPDAQIQAQLDDAQLAQLHADLKTRAEIPDPMYLKLFRSWPFRPFDVRILPNYVQHPIHYFELFWGSEVWDTLIENTNIYTQYKVT